MLREPPPPGLDAEPTENDEDAASLVTRFGTVVGAGVLAAIIASVPATLRIGDGGAAMRAMEVWGSLAALASPVAILAVGVLRRARAGVRLAVGAHGGLLAGAVLWWCVLELGVLGVFGAVLRAKTHHHGLAGVTFALFALASGLVMGLLAWRGAHALGRAEEGVQRVSLGVAALAAFLAIVLVGVRMARAPELATAAALVDGLALVVAAFFASAQGLARVKALAVAGVPVAAIVLVLGLSTVRAEPALQKDVVRVAPLHAWMLGTVGNDGDEPLLPPVPPPIPPPKASRAR
jgi:hypothetical protein